MYTSPIISLLFISLIFIGNSCDNQKNTAYIPGWNLVWNDEFDNQTIDKPNWDFDIGTGAPTFDSYGISSPHFAPKDFPKDNFSVRWEGQIIIDHTSNYTFYTVSDDGIRLYINDKVIIDQWVPQPAIESKGEIFLEKGTEYSLKIEYFEESGGEALILGWESQQLSKQIISSNYLKTKDGDPGLKGTYFKNKDLRTSKNETSFVRVDKELNWVTGGGWGNNELQYYTDNPTNIRVQNGKLVIEAKKEFFQGSEFTSARIKTKNSWKYGRFEIRAKLPPGRGTWSALWALPTDWAYGAWPLSGEIDIMEHVGYNENEIVTSLHTAAHAGNIAGTDQHGNLKIPKACSEFNNYILEWDEEKIIIKVNEKTSLKYFKSEKSWAEWPFDKSFHLIFNIAVGGWWGGAKGIDNNAFPSKMEIDYIRVYSKKPQTST